MAGEKTGVNIARELLHTEQAKTAESVSKIFSDKILPSEQSKVYRKVTTATRNMQVNNRATIMSSVENNVKAVIDKRSKELVANKLPPMTLLQQEKLMNKVVQKSTGKFKGATLDKRLDVSKRMANERMKSEISQSNTKKGAKLSRNRTSAFLTDKRENGRSILGGSNFKYNERILVSEYNRSTQEATKEFLRDTDLLGRWSLSPNHKIFDICDHLATGTGDKANRIIDALNMPIHREGVYEVEEMPEYPHPYCQCDIEPIYMAYGIYGTSNKYIWDNLGENMVPYNEGLVGKESKEYYEEWLRREAKTVMPFNAEKKDMAVIKKKLDAIDRKVRGSFDGSLAIKNKQLEKYVAEGGFRGYEELSKNLLGYALDKETVDAIGVDNALKMLTRDIMKKDNVDDIINALARYNDGKLRVAMVKSVNESRKLMIEADGYRRQVLAGTPKRTVQGLRSKALQKARTELGDAVGYSEAHERLLTQLTSGKPIKFMNINVKDEKMVGRIESLLGLEPYEYKILTRNGKKFMAIGDDGLGKLAQRYDNKTQLVLTQRLDDIRAGKMNKKGWLPANFKEEFTDKATGQQVKFSLRPDQQTGIRFAKENKSAMFHYKPGAGKTHTAMGTITELASEGKIKKALIVVPSDNLVRQFGDEFEYFTKGITTRSMTYQSHSLRLKEYAGEQLVTIISQGQLKADAVDLAKAGFDLVVADEIHMLSDEAFKALKGISSKYRIGMTGTAIKNSVTDLYDALDWLSPVGMPSRTAFNAKFKDITKASSVYQEAVLRDLRNTLKPLVITKDSPVKAKLYVKNVKVVLSKEQLEQISDIERQALAKIDAGKAKKEVEAIRDRALGKVINTGDASTNAKMVEVTKLIERHADEKVIIFASDKGAIGTLKEGLGEKAVYYDASITKAQRNQLVKEFRTNKDLKIMVIGEQGFTGLNIEPSNVAIHWDMPDQYFKLEQRMARNWRGMKTDTTYQYLLQSQTTYDSRINNALEKSRLISQSAKIAESLDEQGVAKTLNDVLRRK